MLKATLHSVHPALLQPYAKLNYHMKNYREEHSALLQKTVFLQLVTVLYFANGFLATAVCSRAKKSVR